SEDRFLQIITYYLTERLHHYFPTRRSSDLVSGLTLSDYIKNRKLSEANKDLLHGDKVTDVAFKYGYQSVDGFSRSFKKWSGFLPSDVIKKGVSQSFPKLSFVITVKGEIGRAH